METPFYLLVIRYNFRNRAGETAQDRLKGATRPGNMKVHGAIFARGAHAGRSVAEGSDFHDQNGGCPVRCHAAGRVCFLPCLQGKAAHAAVSGHNGGRRGPVLPQVQA